MHRRHTNSPQFPNLKLGAREIFIFLNVATRYETCFFDHFLFTPRVKPMLYVSQLSKLLTCKDGLFFSHHSNSN